MITATQVAAAIGTSLAAACGNCGQSRQQRQATTTMVLFNKRLRCYCGGYGIGNTLFPLTPTLSLPPSLRSYGVTSRERETITAALNEFRALVLFKNRGNKLPLPKGEGRGEGEAGVG